MLLLCASVLASVLGGWGLQAMCPVGTQSLLKRTIAYLDIPFPHTDPVQGQSGPARDFLGGHDPMQQCGAVWSSAFHLYHR